MGVSWQGGKSCGKESFSVVSEKTQRATDTGTPLEPLEDAGVHFQILYDPCVVPFDTFEPIHLVRNEPQWLPDGVVGCEAHKQLAKNYS